jgi:hypothetical protein
VTWGTSSAAERILANGPVTQERWENAVGYPREIAAEIAGSCVCADAQAGASDLAARYRSIADDWRSRLDQWTVTTTGPLSASPHFLRLSVDGNANAGTTYTLADGGPTVDQRTVVDPSFLELVRLGVLRADDAAVLSTLPVIDRELGLDTPNGQFWYRYNHALRRFDGRPFGTNDGWDARADFGERGGEYELPRASCPGTSRLAERQRRNASTRSRTPPSTASCSPNRSGTTTPLPAPTAASQEPARAPRHRSDGRTLSSSGSPGRSMPDTRSSARPWSAAATAAHAPAPPPENPKQTTAVHAHWRTLNDAVQAAIVYQ